MLEQFMAIFYEVLPVLLTLLIPVALVFLNNLYKKQTEKLDAETVEKLDAIMDRAITQGVNYAEQWAKNKRKAEKQKVDGNEKLREATSFILQELSSRGVTNLAQETIQRQIESKLGSKIGENV